MIFGSFHFIESLESNKRLQKIRRLIKWNGIAELPFKINTFEGGVFLNPEFPYQLNDFFHFDAERKIVVFMSGNIYNRKEFLSSFGFPKETTNPALISKMFLSRGPAFVENLNGDFAICIYLPETKEVFLFRDHIGIQPLVYAIDNDQLFFSTDITGLCRAFFEQETIFMPPLLSNKIAVNHLLTLNPKVEKLAPGHYLHFSSNQKKIVKYWFPEKIKTNYNLRYDELIDTAQTLLLDAVAIRCDKNFRAGAHLSGGIDSSLIAAIARKNYPNQNSFWGFSWSPDGEAPKGVADDERVLIREIAELNNIKVAFSNPTNNELIHYLHNYYHNLGYFHEEKTMENAVKEKVNLLFSGWGGNEFLSKFDTGIDTDLLLEFRFKKFFEKNPLNKPRKLAQTLFYFILLPAIGVLDYPMRKAYRESSYYFKKAYMKNDRETIRKFFFYRSRRERHLNFIYNYFISERTEIQYHIGFRKGIEFRYPLLDKRIIEFMLQVPSHLMVRKELDRVIMRDLSKDWLPESVWNRKSFMDPVLIETTKIKVRELGKLLGDEIEHWKENPDLYFVDFDLLRNDVERARKNPDSKKIDPLYTNVLFFKMLHEFTKTYRSVPSKEG